MDAIAASELDGGGFWGGGTFDRMSGWHVGGEEEEGEEDLPYGIGVWQRGSLSMRDLGPAAEEDVGIDVGFGGDGYGYASSYGYDNHGFNTGEWGSGIVDSESTGAIPPRRGEKRRSDSLLGDGFDRPQTPSSSSGALGSPLQASSSKGRGAGTGTGTGTGTGSLFFKTKLCVKFRAGTCPYNSNCNFAHGIEELRKPPPGWEEMVAVQDGGGGGRNIKENSSGQLVLSSSDSQRFRRTRRCKKYYSEEGCPYGERCNFLHDDQAKARESNAISLGPSASSPVSGGGGGGGGGSGGGGNGGGGERPSNWKTRMCNKWEMTGHCPFGQKCNFAHGLAELQMYAGVPVDSDPRTTLGGGLLSDSKQTARAASKNFPDVGSPFVSTVYGTDGHNLSTTLRHRSTYSSYSKSQKQVKLLENWKGPADEISMIYGDWIEEEE